MIQAGRQTISADDRFVNETQLIYEFNESQIKVYLLIVNVKIMFRRFAKVGLATGLVVGSVYTLQTNHWEISTIGAVRIGRAAVTVSSIVLDYKKNLRLMNSETEEYAKMISQIHKRSAEKLLELCCLNGGVFIKVGQHIGALDYLLPSEYVNTMKVLHSQAPKASLQSVHDVIREEFSQDPSDLFSEFGDEPIGAASLAQVHRAKLKDGTDVAVKVQHMNVRHHSFIDMKSMELLVHVVAKLFPEFSFLWLVNEMKINLPLELDFINEGHNAERVGRTFSHLSWLKVPKIFWSYSTNRVLTMEFVDGCQINDLSYMQENKIPVNQVTGLVGQLYSEMIFIHGYVHCDPHPGNILVQKTKNGNAKIILLDHGLYATLNDDFRVTYSKMWFSLLNADVEGIKHYSKVLGVGNFYGLLACMMTARSWNAISDQGIKKQKMTVEERNEIRDNAITYFPQINNILQSVPREMLLILRTNDLLRGIESSLKTVGAMSFVSMSRCCAKAVYHQKLRDCTTWWCYIRTNVSLNYFLSKLFVYEVYLILKNFSALTFTYFEIPKFIRNYVFKFL